MQRNQQFLVCRVLWSLALLAGSVPTAIAQHTEVRNNGVNGKIEMDYNAAGKVTETRTVGPDGKVQQKVDYEYLPGYYTAQQTDTTYWPNGKIRKITHASYDASANFTGEFVQTFDESGKQVGGHKLTHDPWTGVYRCNEWNPAVKDYKAIQCPAGEEESGGAEEIKKFTYEEVMQHLDTARKAAQQEQKMSHMLPATPVQPPVTTVNKEVGVITPLQLSPGERVSGRVVENPDQYEGMPGVTVTRVEVPFESAGEASRLFGWYVEIPGEAQQRADGPITFAAPNGGLGLHITFRQAGNPADSVSKTLKFSAGAGKKAPLPKSYKAAAICLKGQLCVVSGTFGGDSSQIFAAFEERPATVVAETSDSLYVSIPESTQPGFRPLFISEGAKVIALPVVVGDFFIKNNGRELQAGQTLIVFPTLDGPGDIPDPEWRSGNFPATNLEQARQLIPGFQLPGNKREKHEKEGSKKHEGGEKGGEILLVIRNVTPEQFSLRASKNDMLVFHLGDEAFSRGEFKYDLVVECKKDGKVDVKGYAIPFLAPISGQEFTAKADAAAQ